MNLMKRDVEVRHKLYMTHFSGSFIRLQIRTSVCQIIALPVIHKSIQAFICPFNHPLIRQSNHLSSHLPIYLLFHPLIHPSIHHLTNSSNDLSIQSPSINPLIHQHQLKHSFFYSFRIPPILQSFIYSSMR